MFGQMSLKHVTALLSRHPEQVSVLIPNVTTRHNHGNAPSSGCGSHLTIYKNSDSQSSYKKQLPTCLEISYYTIRLYLR
jgi:hypothetical protein